MSASKLRDRTPEIRAVRSSTDGFCMWQYNKLGNSLIMQSYLKPFAWYYLHPQAGKVTPQSGGARECIVSPEVQPSTPERVRKFRGATRPAPGERRILHSFANDAPPNPDLRHGVITKTSLEASCNRASNMHGLYACAITMLKCWSEKHGLNE